MNSKPTLLFIPDISGFTKFMSEASPNFSNEVIPALLNQIIYSNEIGLKVSEIEGDAVFFYKINDLPSFDNLITQCKLFYTEFYKKMRDLMTKREPGDGKNLDKQLGLKIILHHGDEVGAVQIGNRIKLMGEDIITAHKLLKNDIELNEYLLISDNLLNQYNEVDINGLINWSPIVKSKSYYEHIGNIGYAYVDLLPLIK